MQWLIEGPNDTLMLDVATATRYVTERLDKTSDAIVKSNADKTLASLAKLDSTLGVLNYLKAQSWSLWGQVLKPRYFDAVRSVL